MKTSLTSVTLRKKSVEEIVDLVAQAGIGAIEFVKDDTSEQFLADAKTLKEILAAV